MRVHLKSNDGCPYKERHIWRHPHKHKGRVYHVKAGAETVRVYL